MNTDRSQPPMNRPIRWLILAALAATGYIAGARLPLAEHRSDRPSTAGAAAPETSPTPGASRSDGPRRDPRTGATFAESRDRLKELSQAPKTSLFLPDKERLGKDQLELARLFALASREEMLEFLAGTDFSKCDPFVPSLAYARLAELSLEEAVSIWSDQFRRTGKTAGIDGLVETWAKQDPAAAERWVDGLGDPTTRSFALFALLKGAVETDPDLVERRLTEVGGLHEPNILVNLLAWKLAPSRFSSLADRVLAARWDFWGGQDHLGALLEVWGKRDGTSMMAWLTSQAPGRLHDHVLVRVAESRAKADPAAFVRDIGPSLAGNEALAGMAGTAWLSWLQSDDDPDGAVDWFRTHGAALKPGEETGWYAPSWTEASARSALERLSQLPDGEGKQQFTLIVLRGLSSVDPRAALDEGKHLLPPGDMADEFIAHALWNLSSEGDPGEAMDWALRNLESESGQLNAVQSIMDVWARRHPLAALDRAGQLPVPLNSFAYRSIARRLAQSAPDQLLRHLKSAPDPTGQASLAREAFRTLGEKRGGEAYLAEALGLPDETLRTQAVEALFDGWSGTNAETAAAALQTLAPGPLRDAAIAQFARRVESIDREAAFAWSLEIEDPSKRRKTLFDRAKRWFQADREAATRWIETSTKLSDEWREELLKAER